MIKIWIRGIGWTIKYDCLVLTSAIYFGKNQYRKLLFSWQHISYGRNLPSVLLIDNGKTAPHLSERAVRVYYFVFAIY